MPQQPSPEQALTGMRTPEQDQHPEQEQRYRTIAVRVEEEVHAQLQFIAQLGRTSLAEEIREAIGKRISNAQNDPDLIAKAQAAREEIQRDADARAAAIAGFMGKPAVANATQPRRATKSSD